MPTNHDETPHERYVREHETELAMLAKMKPEQIHEMSLELHNALAERDTLRQQLAEMTKRAKTAEREAGKALRTFKGLEKVAKVVSDNSDQVCGELNFMRQQRDRLAGLLDRVTTEVGRTITSELREEIAAALAEVQP